MTAWQIGVLVLLGLVTVGWGLDGWLTWRQDRARARARAARIAALESHHATVPGLIDWTAWEREVRS